MFTLNLMSSRRRGFTSGKLSFQIPDLFNQENEDEIGNSSLNHDTRLTSVDLLSQGRNAALITLDCASLDQLLLPQSMQ